MTALYVDQKQAIANRYLPEQVMKPISRGHRKHTATQAGCARPPTRATRQVDEEWAIVRKD